MDLLNISWRSEPDRVVRAGWNADAAVGILQLSRPQKGNAWNADMWQDWYKAVELLATCDTLRVVRAAFSAAGQQLLQAGLGCVHGWLHSNAAQQACNCIWQSIVLYADALLGKN